MRKDFIVAIQYAKYLAFILATICVLIFQFIAKNIFISFALSLYVVAFSLMCASCILHAVEVYEADKLVKKNKMKTINPETNNTDLISSENLKVDGEPVEPVSLKREMVWSVIGSIFFGLFAIFTLIVLILY